MLLRLHYDHEPQLQSISNVPMQLVLDTVSYQRDALCSSSVCSRSPKKRNFIREALLGNPNYKSWSAVLSRDAFEPAIQIPDPNKSQWHLCIPVFQAPWYAVEQRWLKAALLRPPLATRPCEIHGNALCKTLHTCRPALYPHYAKMTAAKNVCSVLNPKQGSPRHLLMVFQSIQDHIANPSDGTCVRQTVG